MIEEINHAVTWWSRQLRSGSNPVGEETANLFAAGLSSILVRRYTGHWYIDDCARGQAFRAIVYDHRCDPALIAAAKAAGIQDVAERLIHSRAIMFVDPGEVKVKSVSMGVDEWESPVESIYAASPATPTSASGSPASSPTSSSSSSSHTAVDLEAGATTKHPHRLRILSADTLIHHGTRSRSTGGSSSDSSPSPSPPSSPSSSRSSTPSPPPRASSQSPPSALSLQAAEFVPSFSLTGTGAPRQHRSQTSSSWRSSTASPSTSTGVHHSHHARSTSRPTTGGLDFEYAAHTHHHSTTTPRSARPHHVMTPVSMMTVHAAAGAAAAASAPYTPPRRRTTGRVATASAT